MCRVIKELLLLVIGALLCYFVLQGFKARAACPNTHYCILYKQSHKQFTTIWLFCSFLAIQLYMFAMQKWWEL